MIKNLYKKLVLFLAILTCVFVNAQEKDSYVLKGQITDQFSMPLAGALITDANNNQAYSNMNGHFEISIKDSNQILVELDNYESQQVEVTNTIENLKITLKDKNVFFEEKDKINIPFGTLEKGRIVGAVSAIDIEDHFNKDQRIAIGSAITGKVGGVYNNSNVLGLGSAVYIVDGIPRSPEYVNLTEVAEITILKDATSRVLYGSQADKGVILITTKRGSKTKRNISVRADYGIQSPLALPEYLNAADYMVAYNQANLNDGKPIKYPSAFIDENRTGLNPLFNPDVDYYGNTFLKKDVSYFDANMEASGGNENAQYLLNMGFSTNEGWLNLGDQEISNRVNLRANTDYKLSSRLKMRLDAVALFNIYQSPDVFDVDDNGSVTSDFWSKAQSNLPNLYPLLIPISSIADPASYAGANLVDGQYLLGGTSEFTRNIYGDLTNRGTKRINDRYFQINTGLNWDLGFITEGLSIKSDITFDFFNTYVENQNKAYAVYQPTMVGNDISVIKIGADVPSNEQSLNENEAYFSRKLGLYTTLNYKRDFGKNSFDVTGLMYMNEWALPNTQQNIKSLNYGLRANYMYDKKYVMEFSGAVIGSRKLAKADRFAFAPTFGLGWILSNEDFFNNTIKADYLKFRGSVGLLKNDNWDNHFLYETSFSTGGYFNYSNTTGNNAVRNRELNYNNIAADVEWQKRLEVNIGFEGLFLNKSLYADASIFRTKSFDLITELNNSTPDLLGYVITSNNNAFVDSGLEYTLKYTKNINDNWKISIGHNSIFATSKVDKLDEPIYGPNAQTRIRTGNNSSAMFGLTADGLYGPSDFNLDGTLVSGLPTTTFGSVQPGDIKYVDINNDGVINDDDQSIIGNGRPDVQYSFDLNISFKNLDFYILGFGQAGQDRYRNSSYFWSYGEQKYSVTALDAYGPNNLDTNASMPRLSSTKNNNNYRNSSFWIYKSNYFTIPTMQLSYNLKSASKKYFNDMKLFVKGNNLLIINSNKDIDNLRFGVGSSPLTKSVSLGVITSF